MAINSLTSPFQDDQAPQLCSSLCAGTRLLRVKWLQEFDVFKFEINTYTFQKFGISCMLYKMIESVQCWNVLAAFNACHAIFICSFQFIFITSFVITHNIEYEIPLLSSYNALTRTAVVLWSIEDVQAP